VPEGVDGDRDLLVDLRADERRRRLGRCTRSQSDCTSSVGKREVLSSPLTSSMPPGRWK
jgi:hypothetical protein